MEEIKVPPSPSGRPRSSSALPSKFSFSQEVSTNGRTPSPVVRRFSSSDVFPASPVANGGVSSLVLMNRNSDFTRTVYEIDNGLLKQIRSSVKSKAPRDDDNDEHKDGSAETPISAVPLSAASRAAAVSAGAVAAAAGGLKDASIISAIPMVPGEPPTVERQAGVPIKLDFTAVAMTPSVVVVPKKSEGLSVVVGEHETKPAKKKEAKPINNHLMIKLGILLSRSSGRDKFCAFLQYGSMFWGNQKVFAVSSARDAPWRNLEESMSAGRKTLRLFKWIKEFERMQRAYAVSDPGPHATEVRTRIASVLGLLMHTFSFAYYFIDNVLYTSQIGLINRPNVTGVFELRKILKSGVSHDEYMKLQHKYRSDEVLRQESRQFESQLKDMKNYSSLLRLVFAIVYSSLQVDSVTKAEKVVREERATNEKDKKKQLWELGELKDESLKEIIASVCNLIILLNRLQMGAFKRVPLWGVGMLGMIAALFGLDKNWPREKPTF